MRILVTGDRDWTDRQTIFRVLADWVKFTKPEAIIHGDAQGADTIAGEVGKALGISVIPVPADWHPIRPDGTTYYDKAAGVKRNQKMLDVYKPDVVLGFHDDIKNSKGTRDMMDRAYKAGVETRLYKSGAPGGFSWEYGYSSSAYL